MRSAQRDGFLGCAMSCPPLTPRPILSRGPSVDAGQTVTFHRSSLPVQNDTFVMIQ
jgi:hypothetical protein